MGVEKMYKSSELDTTIGNNPRERHSQPIEQSRQHQMTSTVTGADRSARPAGDWSVLRIGERSIVPVGERSVMPVGERRLVPATHHPPSSEESLGLAECVSNGSTCVALEDSYTSAVSLASSVCNVNITTTTAPNIGGDESLGLSSMLPDLSSCAVAENTSTHLYDSPAENIFTMGTTIDRDWNIGEDQISDAAQSLSQVSTCAGAENTSEPPVATPADSVFSMTSTVDRILGMVEGSSKVSPCAVVEKHSPVDSRKPTANGGEPGKQQGIAVDLGDGSFSRKNACSVAVKSSESVVNTSDSVYSTTSTIDQILRTAEQYNTPVPSPDDNAVFTLASTTDQLLKKNSTLFDSPAENLFCMTSNSVEEPSTIIAAPFQTAYFPVSDNVFNPKTAPLAEESTEGLCVDSMTDLSKNTSAGRISHDGRSSCFSNTSLDTVIDCNIASDATVDENVTPIGSAERLPKKVVGSASDTSSLSSKYCNSASTTSADSITSLDTNEITELIKRSSVDFRADSYWSGYPTDFKSTKILHGSDILTTVEEVTELTEVSSNTSFSSLLTIQASLSTCNGCLSHDSSISISSTDASDSTSLVSTTSVDTLMDELAVCDGPRYVLPTVSVVRREKRPDRAVYVPRARRSFTTPSTTATMSAPVMATSNGSCDTTQRKDASDAAPSGSSSVRLAPPAKADDSVAASKSKMKKSARASRESHSIGDRSKGTTTVAVNPTKPARTDSKVDRSDGDNVFLRDAKSKATTSKDSCDTALKDGSSVHRNPVGDNADNVRRKNGAVSAKNEDNNVSSRRIRKKSISEEVLQRVQQLHIEQFGSEEKTLKPQKCDVEEEELQRASKEINRSNRRIIKQTFVSDVLEIPDRIERKIEEGCIEKAKYIAPQKISNNSLVDSTTEEEEDELEGDEDDWEHMYDETGNCLDPKILEELEQNVGKVKIEMPQADYSMYLSKQDLLNAEEYPHVLELSHFPVEFKNQDLFMMFSVYRDSGFDIKWVDDTHALAVFSNSKIAAEVLARGHPFATVKPLAEATPESRLKAKKCAASLQPYRARPETCAALARRLVTGALGVRLKTAAAERENEKKVLREAKERKLLAAKQRDEAWES